MNKSPLRRLPRGTLSLSEFIEKYDIPRILIECHIFSGDIKVLKLQWIHRTCRYLTPIQQEEALAFWDKHGLKRRRKYRTPKQPWNMKEQQA